MHLRFMSCRAALMLLLLTGHATSVFGQGTRADYDRSDKLEAKFNRSVFYDCITPHWSSDGNAFWYRSHDTDGGCQYYWVDAIAGTRVLAFDRSLLADALTAQTGHAENPGWLPIVAIEMSMKGEIVDDINGNRWLVSHDNVTIPRPADHASTIPSLDTVVQIAASPISGAATTLTFVNRTAEDIHVSCIDCNGRIHMFCDLRAGELWDECTYAGAMWQVTDPRGKTLGIYRAVEGGGNAVIEAQASPTNRGGLAQAATKPSSNPSRNPDSDPQPSPDGKWAAFVRDNNVFVRDLQAFHEYQLTYDGHDRDGYDSSFAWSPDSTKLVASRRIDGEWRPCYLVQSSPPDQIQPRLESFWCYRPGDKIPSATIHLFDVVAHKEIHIGNKLFPDSIQWDVLDSVQWQPDSRRFLFCYCQRGSQLERIIAVNAASGDTTAIIEEKSHTSIDAQHKWFFDYLDRTGEVIWMSERDGWNHLYLYDETTGRVKNQITGGNWVVRGVDRVDEKKRQIWFHASGLVKGQNPYYLHYCRVNFDGSGMVDFTPANGTHAVTFSPDGQFFTDTYSCVNVPPVSELRRTSDGALVCLLEKADASALIEQGWHAPESFKAKGRDGATDIYGVIYRPTNFNPRNKYPVIEDIYASPDDSFVPTAFAAYREEMSLAELGFIVVQIDGMGTNNRSRAFHDVSWRNLGDAGLPDRVLWIKAAAAKYPYMDLSRVGIYGGSEGGQNALRALEAFGDFYKVAVAICGCHDNRLGDFYWTEAHMGWPIGPWYAEQSNVTNASKMNGKLLLISCELDRVVDPASTMQVVNALIKADKDFDLLVIPNADHCDIGEYGQRRIKDFFVRNLLGVEPRSH